MDKIDDRYKNGKIYEISSNNTDMRYIGSCYTTLNNRLINHKSSKDCASKYILECEDYNINLIEDYSCNNKRELRIREQYWIDEYRREGKNVINKYNAYTTKKKRLEQNKQEYIKNIETYKKYYKNNREKLNKHNKDYYLNNREKRIEYQKEYMREFRFMNRKNVVNACYEFLEMLKQY